jgi:uncharacterized protein YfaS (alpha-2-macroglobulin family)
MDLSDFVIDGAYHQRLKAFVYGPRDLYRGGEKLEYNIILRDYDGRPVSMGAVSVKLTNPQGAEVESINAAIRTDYNYYPYSYNLPPNAPTGEWTLDVIVAGKSIRQHRFSVEDFMPETLRLVVGNPAEPMIVPESTAKTVKVQGDYLYGAPASGNDLQINYNVRPGVYISDKLRNYSFGIDKPDLRSMNNRVDGLKLNDRGYFERTLSGGAFSLEESLSPVKVQYFVTLYESGGRAINRAKEYVYLPTGQAIGIKPNFSGYASTTAANSFSLVNINEIDEAVDAKLKVTLYKENRNYYWNYDNNRGWESSYTSVFYPVESKELVLQNGPADISLKTEYGPYAIEVKNLDSGQTTRHEFYSGSWWRSDGGEITTSPDKLNILFNRDSYKAGDTAKITITSPYDGKGMVMVENTDGKLFTKNITIKSKMAVVDIPIGADWDRHDIYVSAYLARPEKEMEKTQKSLIFGIEHLRLNREDRRIGLTVTHPEKVEPDEAFEILVKADNPALVGNKAMVTVAVVDQGILSLKAFTTPDAWKFFFAKERYATVIWDNFWQVIHKYTDKMALRYGGDAELAQAMSAVGGDLARADVKIVSVFTEPVTFDAKGEARVPLTIPDFNGEVRVMAMAFSRDAYGSAESTMKVAQPVITELAMPRFLATGDQTNLTLDLRNMTDAVQHLTVKATVTEPIALYGIKSFSQTVDLAVGEKAILNIPVEAVGATGMAAINVDVTGYVKPIRRNWRLAVRPAYPAVSETQLIKV